MLRIGGELDAVTAGEFAAHAARALEGGAGRLVLDLSELRFADCSGARALASVAGAVADDGPVTVRAARPAVRRVLELTGTDLARGPRLAEPVLASWPASSGLRSGHDEVVQSSADTLVRQSQATRIRTQDAMAQSRRVAGAVAVTEDRVARTMARLAKQRPGRAGRLNELSQDARQEAAYLRRRAWPGLGWTAQGPGASPLATWLTAGESGLEVVLSGQADMRSSGELAELLVSLATRNARQLTVDVSGLSFVDASAVRALVLAAKLLGAQDGVLLLLRPQRPVVRVLSLLEAGHLIAAP